MNKFDKNNILLLIVYLIYAGLLLPSLIANYILIGFLIFCLFFLIKEKLWSYPFDNKLTLLLVLFYLLHIVGLLYTENTKQGLFDLEKKISLIAIPLLASPLFNQLTFVNIHRLRIGIGLISLASSLGYLAFAGFRYYIMFDKDAFYFENFIPYNYVYFSYYFSFAILCLMYEFWTVTIKPFWRFAILFVLPAYALAILTVVSSKMGIISFLVGYFVLLIFYIKNYKLVIAGVVSILLISVLLISTNITTLERFINLKEKVEILKKDKYSYDEPFTGLTLRLTFWRLAVKHLVEDDTYVFGTGTGDAQDYLNKIYALHNLDAGGYKDFNPHNQWVQTFLQLGLLGVFLLALIFTLSVIRAIKNNNFILLLFLIISLCFALSESILEVNKGIVFFSLFITILVSTQKLNQDGTSSIGNNLKKSKEH